MFLFRSFSRFPFFIYSCVCSFCFSSVAFAEQAQAQSEASLQVAGGGGSSPQSQGTAPAWVNIILIFGIILFMWLFVFRPQSKRAKEQKVFLSSLVPGMEVITTGGMIGTIVDVKEDQVYLNLGHTTVRVIKSAISGKAGILEAASLSQ